MGLFKSTTQFVARAAALANRRTEDVLKATGDVLSEATKFVSGHQQAISEKTHEVFQASGKAVKDAGATMAAKADAVSEQFHNEHSPQDAISMRALGHVVGYTADAVSAAGKLAGKVGAYTQKASPAIGAATGSAVSGIVRAVTGAVDSVAITERQFDQLRLRLQNASLSVKAQTDQKNLLILRAQREHRKQDLLDMLVVGGVSLADIVADPLRIPSDVEKAFEFAYPGLARAGETLADVVERLPSEDLVGLVSGVKGKLFEIELVEHLNAGNLEAGLHAELAGSATQPGYDVQIIGDNGHLVDVLQAKATESVAYVKEALERYPGIDVTTTTEVHAQLMALGVAENVTDSGISESVLERKIEAAFDSGGELNATDFIPSSIGLAVIALSSFMDKSLTLEQRGAEFGDRAAKAGVTGTAAKAALVATNTWWVALIVGVGSRYLTTYGGNKRDRYEMLERAVQTLETKTSKPAGALCHHPI